MTVRRDLILTAIVDYFDVGMLADINVEELADEIDRGLPPEEPDELEVYHYARGLADGLAAIDDE